MASLTFDALWRDHGVAKGLKTLGQAADDAKVRLAKLERGQASAGRGFATMGARLGGNFRVGFMKPIAGLPGIIAGLVGGAVVMGAKKLATEASDMNETVSKSRTIFGTSSKAIESWARGAAKNLGMSRQQALDGASAFGNLFDQLGFGVTQSSKMSKGFAQMATDAASFNNADPSEVMDAFLSATRGEYDALQRYIPTASAATIEAEALRMSHKESAKDLTAADKAAALYSVSTRDLGKAHGDFAKTSGGFANQQRIMAANWADLRVKIGTYFLPVFTKAAKYMNTEGFPALTRIADALGSTGQAAGRMGRAVGGALSAGFGRAFDKATVNLTEIADWMETHQAKMVGFFIRLGDGAFSVARAVTTMTAGGIRGFGNFAGAIGDFLGGVGPGLQSFMHAMADIVGFFGDKDMGKAMHKSADQLGVSFGKAATSLQNTKTKAHETASAFENKVNPVLDKAQEALHRVGNEEIWKAKQRDAAAAAAIAIRDIGTKADGSQIKLKTFAGISKLSADEQRGLRGRINEARVALAEQLTAVNKAGGGQKELTKTWEKGRTALYKEFVQMGLSKTEAQKLADKYAGIKPKVETKVTQPGMHGFTGALQSFDRLDTKMQALDDKSVTVGINWRTSVDGYKTSFTGEYFGGKFNSGPSLRVPFGANIGGPPLSAPEDVHGGPTVTANVRGGVPKFTPSHNRITQYSGRRLTSFAGDRLRDDVTVADSTAPGGRVGVTPRSMAATMLAMQHAGARRFTTYPGHHPSMNKARDVTPHNWAIANAARASSSVWYVIYRMMIASKNHGNVWRPYHPTNFRGDWQHTRHVHVGWYDKGGMLPPGISLAVNKTGRAEVVRPGGGPAVIELGPRSIAAIASALTVEIDGKQVARAVRYQTVRGTT